MKPLKWRAVYQDNILSENWKSIPDGILAVIIHETGIHRLIGADYYWLSEDAYGMIYDGSCCVAGHTWWKNGVKMDAKPPVNIISKKGLMLPDKEWQNFMEGLRV